MSGAGKVFVSRVSRELASYGEVVAKELRVGELLAVEQSTFPPDHRTLRHKLEEKLKGCCAAICLVGRGFGSAPKDRPDKSYTQLEYDLAREMAKPVFVFLAREDCVADTGRRAGDNPLDEPTVFVELQRRHLAAIRAGDDEYGEFSSREELGQHIAHLVPQVLRLTGGTGPVEVAPSRLPGTTKQFVGREDVLARLDMAWNDPRTRVAVIVARGGEGKTTLAKQWRNHLAEHDFCGARRVFDWSFYSQGTRDQAASADEFIDKALQFFGDNEPTRGNLWDRGSRLARLVGSEKSLLILDGLEPLQYPPGAMHDRLKDPAIHALLAGLADQNAGLCLVTTRVPVAELADWPNTCLEISLDSLSSDDGMELLSMLGVRGQPAELREAVDEVKGHALTLNLLGNYLKRVHAGDVRCRHEVDLMRADEKQGGHARKVMEAYERWFQKNGQHAELAVLRLLGLFDRRAQPSALDVLCAPPRIPGLTDALADLDDDDWHLAVANLDELGLVQRAELQIRNGTHTRESLDAHPLVREHFESRLADEFPDAASEGHRRLYDFLSASAPEYPETLSGIMPLYEAVAHACKAGLHQRAFDEVLRKRVQREEEYFSTRMLGAFGVELGSLSHFFVRPWDTPSSSLSEESQALLLGIVGYELRALGRLSEAIKPMRAALEAATQHQDWLRAARAAGNLSQLYIALGDLTAGYDAAKQSVDLADRSGDPFQRESKRATLADVHHHCGRYAQAEASFLEAERLREERNAPHSFLYSLLDHQHCIFLLGEVERALAKQGCRSGVGQSLQASGEDGLNRLEDRCHEVRSRAIRSLEWNTQKNWTYGVALDHLTLGRTYLREFLVAELRADEASNECLSSPKALPFDFLFQAADHFDLAVNGMREAGRIDQVPRSLLARASLRRVQGQNSESLRSWTCRVSAARPADEGQVGTGMAKAGSWNPADYFGAAEADLRQAEAIAERGPMRLHLTVCQLEWARLYLATRDLAAARQRVAQARALIEQTGYHRRGVEVAALEQALVDAHDKRTCR